MELTSSGFNNGERIPDECAFCNPDPTRHVCLGQNQSPQLAWHDIPQGCQSFVLICHDPDVPSRGDDVNQEGKSIPASLPRVDFFHWVAVDIPATVVSINAGAFSSEVTRQGKPGPAGPFGSRQGINNYTDWFAADQNMRGDYYGYDGPCPPWNDEIVHRYIFTVYALDIPTLAVTGRFGAPEVLAAIEGHVLAKGQLTGNYTLNPALR